MDSSRRRFLVNSLSSAMLLGLASPFARASIFSAEDRKRYQAYMPGLFAKKPDAFFVALTPSGNAGLDATLGLDPKLQSDLKDPSDLYLEYRDSDILEVKGLRLGPSAHSLAPHAGDLAVINGIFMGKDLQHRALLQYMQTGDVNGATEHLSVQHANGFDPSALGLISNGASLFTPGQKPIFTDAIALAKTLAAADGGVSDPNLMGAAIEMMRQTLAKMTQIKRNYSSLPSLDLKDGETLRAIAASFLAGAAFDAQIEIKSRGTIDTHIDHPKTHLESQKNFWTDVATVFDYFKKIPYGNGSLFDATTFVVPSEFSRTPVLNTRKGKDHNPFTNSCLVAGHGVLGGQTIGQSRVVSRNDRTDKMPLHTGTGFDFEKGQALEDVSENAKPILPENVVDTLRTILQLKTRGSQSLSKIIRA